MNKASYLVFSMARSGHHAIVNWFCKQFDGKITYYNNCVKGWKKGKLLPRTGIKQEYHNNDNSIAKLYTIEDMDMDHYSKHNFEGFEIFDKSEVHCILIIRDPWNWIASSMKMKNEYAKKFLKEHIGTQIGDGRYLDGSRIDLYKKQLMVAINSDLQSKYRNFSVINYNEWFKNKKYRQSLTEFYGLNFTDEDLNIVHRRGSGSSFGGYKYQNRAQKMDVMNRWKHYCNDEGFQKLVCDPILMKYACEYFKENFYLMPHIRKKMEKLCCQ